MYLPKDPLSRFVDLYHALDADRGWLGDASSLRFAAISALTVPGEPAPIAKAIREIADEIKDRSGWFGSLNSPLRFIVATMLLLHRDSAAGFLAEVDRAGQLFRNAGLRRGGIYETMAILILRVGNEKQPIEPAAIERFQAIYEEMKKHHWWLTGPDDFPACAILVNQPDTPATIGQKIEDIYQELSVAGFSKGDPLQTAANLLYLSHQPPHVIAGRYRELATSFRDAGVQVWRSDYDELAILSFLQQPASRIVPRVMEYRESIAGLKPKPDRSLTFNLAASVAFLEYVQVDEDLKEITDAKALMDMQAIINAQQAAAAAAASTAAVAASSSASS
jgi:hypothetical protein